MRKSLLLLLMISGFLHAQKVKWENDTVYKNNVPYCLIKKTGGLEAVLSIQSLSGKEVAISTVDKNLQDNSGYPYYRVTFTASKKVGDMPNGLNFGKKLAAACVENSIFVNDSLNTGGESRFLILYPERKNTAQNLDLVNSGSADNYALITRDRTAIVTVNGVSIRQSNVEIGSCTSKTNTGIGKVTTTVSFSLASGTRCAEAVFGDAATTTCTITTFKDGGAHMLTIQNMAMKNEEIAKWLVDNYYL